MKLENYKLFADNNKEIGSFELDVDGFYYLWLKEDSKGCWASHTLREIADKLDEVNEFYNKNINEFFKKEQEKMDNCKHEFELVFDFTDMESYLCKKCGLEVFNLEDGK